MTRTCEKTGAAEELTTSLHSFSSSRATLEANKSKKAAKRQAQAAKAAAAGAAVTSATMTDGTAPTKNQIQRQKRKAKIAALKGQQKGPGSESAMQLD